MLFAWWSRGRPFAPSGASRSLSRTVGGGVGYRAFPSCVRIPEYMAENAVDVNHLSHLHGYHETQPGRPGRRRGRGAPAQCVRLQAEGAGSRGLWAVETSVSAVVNLYGLGYSFVNIHERTIDVHARFWVLTTPVDGTRTDLLLACQLRPLARPKRAVLGLRFLPVGLRTRLYTQFLLNGQARDVRQDLPIWSHRRYTPRPKLNRLDGEIMVFRRYCRQFYPGDADNARREPPGRQSGRSALA